MIKLDYNRIKSFKNIPEAFKKQLSKEYLEASKLLVVDSDTLSRLGTDVFDIEALHIFFRLGWRMLVISEKPTEKSISLQKAFEEFKEGEISYAVADGEKRKYILEQASFNNDVKAFFTDKVSDKLHIDDDCSNQYVINSFHAFSFGCTVDFFVHSLSELCYELLSIAEAEEGEDK